MPSKQTEQSNRLQVSIDYSMSFASLVYAFAGLQSLVINKRAVPRAYQRPKDIEAHKSALKLVLTVCESSLMSLALSLSLSLSRSLAVCM
jgi:hypothetical protein